MALQTIRTSAGDFNMRTDEFTSDHDIAQRLARRLGYRAGRASTGGQRTTFEVAMGRHSEGGLLVARTVTVYR